MDDMMDQSPYATFTRSPPRSRVIPLSFTQSRKRQYCCMYPVPSFRCFQPFPPIGAFQNHCAPPILDSMFFCSLCMPTPGKFALDSIHNSFLFSQKQNASEVRNGFRHCYCACCCATYVQGYIFLFTCFTKWLPTTAGAGAPLLVDIPPH